MHTAGNPIHDRFMRLALYVHERRNGVPVVVRRKVQVTADPATGETRWEIKQWKIKRAVVLPARNQREVRQNAGAMAANRAIVQGSSFDSGSRQFIFNRQHMPPDLVLKRDDWIVYHSRHYDIETIIEYESDTAWLVTAKELKGRIEDARLIKATAHDQLAIQSESQLHP